MRCRRLKKRCGARRSGATDYVSLSAQRGSQTFSHRSRDQQAPNSTASFRIRKRYFLTALYTMTCPKIECSREMGMENARPAASPPGDDRGPDPLRIREARAD